MRPFTIIECEQRSPAWFKARAGRLTGSVAADMAATLKKGGEPACRRDLRTKLCLERLTGVSLEDDYLNADMRRGIELEPDAIAEYEALTGTFVTRTGFLASTTLPIGCSLDGYVDDFAGIVEVKCPRAAIHLDYLRERTLPADYRWQVIHNLLVTGATFAEFVSYCPQFPDPLRLFYLRVPRVEAEIDSYRLMLDLFLKEVDKEYAEIEQLAAAGVAA